MAFFTSKQKQLAKKCTAEQLNTGYRLSELKLKQAAEKGNESELKKAMKEHQKFEYAKLYAQTPKFKKGAKRYEGKLSSLC